MIWAPLKGGLWVEVTWPALGELLGLKSIVVRGVEMVGEELGRSHHRRRGVAGGFEWEADGSIDLCGFGN